MTPEEFQDLVVKDCEAKEVEYNASPESYVVWDETKCSGFFFDERSGGPILAYATGKPFEDWFVVLVHEYNHMLQWAEKDPLWEPMQESDARLWSWLSRKIELDPDLARRYVMENMRVELDCERRSVRMIQDLDLPIDLPKYIQKANAYVYFYHMILKHRKWYEVGKEPYSVPEIWEAMPNNLDGGL